MGTDKELSDLLDFSMMFPLPVANGKGRPTLLAGTQFGGSGLEERPSSGSWGTGDQNSSSFDPSRTYGEGGHFTESHSSLSSSTFLGPGLGGKGSERSAYTAFGRDAGVGGLTQTRSPRRSGRCHQVSHPRCTHPAQVMTTVGTPLPIHPPRPPSVPTHPPSTWQMAACTPQQNSGVPQARQASGRCWVGARPPCPSRQAAAALWAVAVVALVAFTSTSAWATHCTAPR